jgi:hypothetical protein
MTINEILIEEIKSKSALASKAIDLYVEYGYSINFTDLNVPQSGGDGVRVELIINNEITATSWCQTITEMVAYFESQLSVLV